MTDGEEGEKDELQKWIPVWTTCFEAKIWIVIIFDVQPQVSRSRSAAVSTAGVLHACSQPIKHTSYKALDC